MTLDPSALKYNDAQKYLLPDETDAASTSIVANYETEILDLIESNDFWQQGKRYVGAMPKIGDDGYEAGLAMIQRSFAPVLKLREVLRRHVRGVIGREPNFEIVLPNVSESRRERFRRADYETSRSTDEALADEIDSLQGEVWDRRKEHKKVDAFAKRLCSTGTAYLRFDVPPARVVEATGSDGQTVHGITATSWQEAYEMIYIELAPRGSASIHTDPSSMARISFYSYTEPRPGKPNETRRCIQVTWLDETETTEVELPNGSKARRPITRVRVVRDDNTEAEWKVDTGGYLLLIDAEREPLLTPDLLRLQDIVSTISTNIKINSDIAGFPQETHVDIDAPEIEVPDPANPGQTKRVPVPLPTGPRTIRRVYSSMLTDEAGNPVTDPSSGMPVFQKGSVQYREPVSSQPLRDDKAAFELDIYRGVNQGHVPARTSAAASATMLVELRSDYADSLIETKPDIESALRDLFHARLCMAAYIAQDAQMLSLLKASRMRVDCNLNAGPLSIEERNEIVARVAAGLLSEETAMVLLGTEDVDAERAKIRAEEQEKLGGPFPPRGTSPARAEAQRAETKNEETDGGEEANPETEPNPAPGIPRGARS